MKNTTVSFITSSVTAICLTILVPLSGFFSSKSDYSFSEKMLLKQLVIPSVLLLLIVFVLQVGFIRYKQRISKEKNNFVNHVSYTNVFVSLVVVAIWIEGMFLTVGLPALDGAKNAYVSPLRLLGSGVIFLVVFIVGSVKWRKIAKHFLLFLLMITICYGLVFVDGYQQGAKGALASEQVTTKRQTVLDNVKIGEKNTYIFVVDALSNANLAEYLKTKDKADLSGFTFYTNNIQSSSKTQYALSTILRGEMFTGGDGTDFQKQAMSEETGMIQDQLKQGKKIYISSILNRFNYTNDQTAVERKEAGIIQPSLFLELSFKYLPYIFKNQVASKLGFTAKDLTSDTISDSEFFEYLNKDTQKQSSIETFQLHHINGSHLPYIYDENGAELAATDQASFKGMRAQTTYVLNQLFYFIDQLKKQGVYEDSTIIIMGDHGDRFYDYKESSKENVYHDFAGLLIKDKNSQAPYKKSSYPMSNLYLREYLKKGELLFETDKGARYCYLDNTKGISKYLEDLPSTASENIPVNESYKATTLAKGKYSLCLLDEDYAIPNKTLNATYQGGWGIRPDKEQFEFSFDTKKNIKNVQFVVNSNVPGKAALTLNNQSFMLHQGKNTIIVKNNGRKNIEIAGQSDSFKELRFIQIDLLN